MLTKDDLKKLAQLRLEDAIYLFQANRSSSAYYLAGYAIELALKACIAELIQPRVIPDKAFLNAFYTHKFDTLVSTAGLLPSYNMAIKADPLFGTNWAIASKWTEESRYQLWDPMSAGSIINAVADHDHGVFEWVKRHW